MKVVLIVILCSVFLIACSPYVTEPPQAVVIDKSYFEGDFQLKDIAQVASIQEDEKLQAYFRDVIGNNKDLKASVATLKALVVQEKIVAAENKPKIDVTLNKQRNKSTAGDSITSHYNLSSDIKWDIDAWGAVSSKQHIEQLRIHQQKLEYQNMRNHVLTQAMQNWLSYWSLQRQLLIIKARIKNAKSLVKITEDAYQYADVSYEELVQKRTATSLLQQQEQRLYEQEAWYLHRLNTLRAQPPKAAIQTTVNTIPPVLSQIPKQIPATALQERPDIQIAFGKVNIFNAEAQIAGKALLPQITLNGTLHKSSNSLADIFSHELLWQLVGGLTQPLFHGGQLKQQVKQKSKEAESAFYHYERVVLKALEEVENTLARENSLFEQVNLIRSRLDEVKHHLDLVEQSYQNGTVDVYSYFNAYEEAATIENEWIMVQESYLINRVALALALGQHFEIRGI